MSDSETVPVRDSEDDPLLLLDMLVESEAVVVCEGDCDGEYEVVTVSERDRLVLVVEDHE